MTWVFWLLAAMWTVGFIGVLRLTMAFLVVEKVVYGNGFDARRHVALSTICWWSLVFLGLLNLEYTLLYPAQTWGPIGIYGLLNWRAHRCAWNVSRRYKSLPE